MGRLKFPRNQLGLEPSTSTHSVSVFRFASLSFASRLESLVPPESFWATCRIKSVRCQTLGQTRLHGRKAAAAVAISGISGHCGENMGFVCYRTDPQQRFPHYEPIRCAVKWIEGAGDQGKEVPGGKLKWKIELITFKRRKP